MMSSPLHYNHHYLIVPTHYQYNSKYLFVVSLYRYKKSQFLQHMFPPLHFQNLYLHQQDKDYRPLELKHLNRLHIKKLHHR
jgi:hypothetical protein